MPGAADHGDPVVAEPAARLPQPQPHMGLAHRLAPVARASSGGGARGSAGGALVRLAQGGHGVGESGEGRVRIGGSGPGGTGRRHSAVLDDVLPPVLGVVVAGRLGEHPQRIQAQLPGRPLLLPALVPQGQGVGRGQVEEPNRHPVLQRPAEGDPLRGESGHRPERGAARVVRRMGQQRDRRAHPLVRREPHHRVGLRRSLHQQHRRPVGVQRRQDGPRRAGAVVAHTQQQRPRRRGTRGARASAGGGDRRPRTGHAHAPASRQAR
ncbi:hypothetical protein IQ279_16110 [Streptomyces verrucosisporus]|nr:hypothetical protein [Streptomyces verrucosisporus]